MVPSSASGQGFLAVDQPKGGFNLVCGRAERVLVMRNKMEVTGVQSHRAIGLGHHASVHSGHVVRPRFLTLARRCCERAIVLAETPQCRRVAQAVPRLPRN